VSTSADGEEGDPHAEEAERDDYDQEDPVSASARMSLSKQQFGIIDRRSRTHLVGDDGGL
jgi:hypothetical protein